MDNITGTAGNDTFNATGATLGAQDVITGGAGTDKLVIVDTTKASEAGLAAATITGVEALELNTNGGVGAFSAAAGTKAGAAQVIDWVVQAGSALIAASHTITAVINGVTHTTTYTGHPTNGIAAKQTAIVDLLNKVLGGTATAAGTSPEITLTSKVVGAAVPTITITETANGASTTTAAVALDSTSNTKTVANEVKADAGAVAQILTVTISEGSTAGYVADNTFTLYIDGVSYGSPVLSSSSTQNTVLSALATTINSQLGSGVAVVTGNTMTITAPTAGTPLPHISIVGGGTDAGASTFAVTRGNVALQTAATSAVVYDASGFAEAFTANGAGDMNVKAAATTDVTLSNTTGKIEVSGGDNVTVSTTGTGTTGIKGTALASVSVKGGGNVTVNNIGGTTASPVDNTGTTLTTVTLQGISGSTAGIGSDAVTTVNLTKQLSALATTVTNAKSTSLNVNADAVGYDKDGGDVTVSVAAGAAAKTMNVSAATKSQLTVSGAALETLTVAGAGAAKINGLSSLALKSVTSTNTAGVTLGALNAATRTLTTGDGDDSATVAATTTVTVDTGAGKDSLSLNATIAAGSSINLGAGNDKLLNAGSGVITTGANSTTGISTAINGGEGDDTIAASLLTVGTAALVSSFEVLGLDLTTNGATFDTEILAGATGLELLKQAASGHNVTYSNVLLSQSLSVNANTDVGSTTLSFKTGQASGTADSYTVTFGAKGLATSTATNTTAIDAGTLVVQGVENVVIVSNQASGFVNNTIDLTSAQLKTVTLTGAATTTTLGFAGTNGTNASAGGGAVNTIDGSALTGALAVNLSGITADNGALGLTVKGGAGKDTITTADNVIATLFGGAGTDTFVVAANVGTAPEVTIGDLASGDKIDMAGTIASSGALGAAANVSSATSLAAALEIANGDSGTVPTAQLSWFQYAGNTYIYSDLNSGTASGTLDANDNIVKITGLINLTGSTYTTDAIITIA